MSRAASSTGSLAGLLVADFSRVLAGPYATMLLADLGADVVKVERPGTGDDTRTWGPPFDPAGRATYFQGVNRNKRSVVLDLTDPDDLASALALAARADVVVENFRPGTMERLGLSEAAVRALNPGVVWCSITGFGSGAGAAMPGYDLLVQAVGGLMSVTGPRPGEPTKVGVALVDVVTGLHAAVGILAALRHRERTGLGQRVETALLSSLLSALVNQASGFVGAGAVPGILGNRHPSIAPYETFATADRPIAVAVGNDKQFRALCQVLGRAELAADERFRDNPGRVAHRGELAALIGSALVGEGSGHWCDALTASGVPCGPVNDLAEAFALAERLGLAPVVDLDGSPEVADPIRMTLTPAEYRRPAPSLGEHTSRVLAELADGDPEGVRDGPADR